MDATDVVCKKDKNKEKVMTSMLLMLVMLGVFIRSSHAVKCYECMGCVPGPDTTTCNGKYCVNYTRTTGGDDADEGESRDRPFS